MIARTPRPRKGPKSVRMAENRLGRLLLDLYDEPMPFEAQWTIPEAWATLEDDLDLAEKRLKVTLRLDESVVKFYRAMGPGYQAAMNRVLATYAQMKIAQMRWFEGSVDDARRQTRDEAMGWDKGGPDGPVYPDLGP